MDSEWHLDDYQNLFEAELARALEGRSDDNLDAGEIARETVQKILPKISNSLFNDLQSQSSRMLREHRSIRRRFVKRNCKRWQEGFDLLESLIVISQETGGAISNALTSAAVENDDALFEALISNHARAVLIAREILCLMTAGFADGAMARWRTLHEIAVVSQFLSQAGRETAERYILHERVASYQRAKNYMEHHERANLDPIEPLVMAELQAMHDELLAKDHRLKTDYGWAAEALNKKRPTFADIEAATELDHWRPRYKWATLNTHGSYLAVNSTLGTSEALNPVRLVGESNSGMTDPAQMTAISLTLATMGVVMLEPNIDRLAAAMVMDRYAVQIGETFWRLDQETLSRARKRENRQSSR